LRTTFATIRGYCTYYHILETIALYDEPQIRGITGLRHDDQSKNGDLYKKTTALKYFTTLFNAVAKKCRRFIMSYSSDSICDINVLSDLLKTKGKVELKTKDYRKYVSQEDQLGADNGVVEYLLICQFQ
jgi:adenine-specific DNA-methyltransferase